MEQRFPMSDEEKAALFAALEALRGQPMPDPPPVLTCAGVHFQRPLRNRAGSREGMPSLEALEKLRSLRIKQEARPSGNQDEFPKSD